MSIAPVTSDIAASDCKENAHSYHSNDCARKTRIAILTPVISAKVVGLSKNNRCVAEAPVTADSVVLFWVRSVKKERKMCIKVPTIYQVVVGLCEKMYQKNV